MAMLIPMTALAIRDALFVSAFPSSVKIACKAVVIEVITVSHEYVGALISI